MSELVRTTLIDGTVAPSALNCLAEIPDRFTHLHRFAVRHPLGIYNLSLEQLEKDLSCVLQRYSTCLDYLESKVGWDGELIDDNFSDGYNDLLAAQKNFILSLRAHIDDCYAVFASIQDPTNVREKSNFTDRWLAAAKFPYLDDFNRAISSYKDEYLGPLVNGLKHRQARMRPIIFYKRFDFRLGYYVEEPGVDGTPGPSPHVHKDRNSAFSFAKDIAFNIFHIYFISDRLKDVLKIALREFHSFALNSRTTTARHNEWQQILRQVAKIPLRVFPDEMEKPIACVNYVERSELCALTLRYPELILWPLFPPKMKIKSAFSFDGVGKTYKLPYFGRALD